MVYPSVRAFIFDLGNVVVNFDHRIATEKIAPYTDKNPEEIYRLFFDSPVVASFETGGIAPQDFYVRVSEMLKLRLGFEGFLPIWNEIFFVTPENHAVYELAKRLSARYPTALLSNINELHFEYLRRTFPVFDAFTHVVASCQMHLCKPDPLLYRKTLELLGVEARDTFYTDDRPELIEGARRLGIQGFVYKGVEQLRRDLTGVGININ